MQTCEKTTLVALFSYQQEYVTRQPSTVSALSCSAFSVSNGDLRSEQNKSLPKALGFHFNSATVQRVFFYDPKYFLCRVTKRNSAFVLYKVLFSCDIKLTAGFFPLDSFMLPFTLSLQEHNCLLCAFKLPPQRAAPFCVSHVPSYSKNWCNVWNSETPPVKTAVWWGADSAVEEEFKGFLRSLSFEINYLPELVRHRSSQGSPPPNFRVGSNRFQTLMSFVF